MDPKSLSQLFISVSVKDNPVLLTVIIIKSPRIGGGPRGMYIFPLYLSPASSKLKFSNLSIMDFDYETNKSNIPQQNKYLVRSILIARFKRKLKPGPLFSDLIKARPSMLSI